MLTTVSFSGLPLCVPDLTGRCFFLTTQSQCLRELRPPCVLRLLGAIGIWKWSYESVIGGAEGYGGEQMAACCGVTGDLWLLPTFSYVPCPPSPYSYVSSPPSPYSPSPLPLLPSFSLLTPPSRPPHLSDPSPPGTVRAAETPCTLSLDLAPSWPCPWRLGLLPRPHAAPSLKP